MKLDFNFDSLINQSINFRLRNIPDYTEGKQWAILPEYLRLVLTLVQRPISNIIRVNIREGIRVKTICIDEFTNKQLLSAWENL